MKSKKVQQGYPRTYESSARRFLYGIGWFFLAFFLGMTPVHLLGLMKNPIAPRDLTLIDVGVLVFVIWIWSQASRRVILHEDAIEVTSWFSTRKLHYSEIFGRRMGKLPKQAGAGLYYIIIPTNCSNRELKLPPYLEVDKYFFDWMRAIPKVER